MLEHDQHTEAARLAVKSRQSISQDMRSGTKKMARSSQYLESYLTAVSEALFTVPDSAAAVLCKLAGRSGWSRLR